VGESLLLDERWFGECDGMGRRWMSFISVVEGMERG